MPVALLDREALARTIRTGETHDRNRSRRVPWQTGAPGGLLRQVVEIRIGEHQEAVGLRVHFPGPADCDPDGFHIGCRSRSCRTTEMKRGRIALVATEETFDPEVVYGDGPSPTVL